MQVYYKFRTKKDKSRVITIRSRDYNKGKSFINEITKDDDRIPKKMDYDFKLQLTWTGRAYLLIPRPIIRKQRHVSDNNTRICAIDPGVRTFASIYDLDGAFYEFGKVRWMDYSLLQAHG